MFADTYAYLLAAQWPAIDAETGFDRHVMACVLSLARFEVEEGASPSISAATGLTLSELSRLINRNFPGLDRRLFDFVACEAPVIDDEEAMLQQLLLRHAANGLELAPLFARIVARRAMHDDHLWQDLGLFSRPELSRMLYRNFPTLAAGNTSNMKWKKYFYRALCEAEGFVLCTAPSCRQCDDFEDCFGTEDGESRLARIRNAAPAEGLFHAGA
ncbi:nitrogen fixation protein NifQ [Martelella alba]|uniref:Nitrogen fixation protein NifQ n=1 Tax=Martelella alba TaxID=2590451 RepID=A0A506U3X3_9HYPH|nr:nitrogen fixation protein NifQ [Martelella alba]TPW28530.1 nitrogen fixation protein NifQ [Martelella alba]